MDEPIEQVASQLAVMALSTAVGWLCGKLRGAKSEREEQRKRAETERDGTREMLRLLLYYRLADFFEKYVVRREPISGGDKHEIEEIYTYYHDVLGGNGEGKRMFDELMRLKTE